MIPIWFVITLFSVFFLAATELYQKYSLTSKKDFPVMVNNFFVSIVMCVTSFIFGGIWLAITGSGVDLSQWKLILLDGVVFFLGCTVFYSSYKGISSSIGTLLNSVSVIFSTIWGISFLSESASWQKLLGISIILAAVVMVNYTAGNAKIKYVLMALCGGFLFSVTYWLDKTILIASHLNPMFYLGFVTIITGLLNFVFAHRNILKELKTFTKKDFYPMLMVGLFAAIFNVMTYVSYTVGGELGKIDAINSLVCFVILAGEIIFLKDRTHIAKKSFAMGLAVVGISLLV